MYKKKANGVLGIFITIVVLIILVILTNIENRNLHFFENVTSSIISPVQNGIMYLKNKIKGNNNFFENIDELKKENEDLKKRVSGLEENLRELEIVKTENTTLKEYLKIAEKYSSFDAKPGYIINRSISNFSKDIIINIGAKDGIEENMTVISAEGLVGHVISVTDNTAKVQTIVDTSSSTSCLMSTTRDSIVCKGSLEDNKTLKGMYIPIDATVIEGDSIETSGIGGIYPKGIYIGKVKNIKNTKNIADRYINIETGVNFDKLESVLVITNSKSEE